MNQGSDFLLAGRARVMTRSVVQAGQGTLAIWPGYGAGNPRDLASGRVASLLKFNLLKLKGCSLKCR